MSAAGDVLGTGLSRVVGAKTASALQRGLGLTTVGDLLRHYPRRYAERGELTDLGALAEGEQVTVMAEVISVTVRPMRQRRGSILEAVISDGRASMTLTFFNQKWRERELRPGRRGLFAGQVSRHRGSLQLAHPDFQLLPDGIADDDSSVLEFAGALKTINLGFPSGYGFTAIIVSFLGRLHPIGCLIAGVVLAVTYVGGQVAQTTVHIPNSTAGIFQAMMLFFILSPPV